MSPGSRAVLLVAGLLLLPLFAVAAAARDGGAEITLPPPVPGDLASVLDAPESGWRSALAEVYRWDRFLDIVILDTASFDVQGRMFARLAYYLEKRGFRGRLLSNQELAERHGWNAHDYGAAVLADFFEAVETSSFP